MSSQLAKATVPIDYILADWQAAGLLKPSFVRPKVAAIEPQLIVHQVGQLSRQDLDEVDHRLRNAMALITSALADVAQRIDFGKQPPAIVQSVAEKSVIAVIAFAAASDPSMELEQIRKLLQ